MSPRRPLAVLMTVLALGACCASAAGNAGIGGDALVHPQDGPHADIRIRIDDTAVQYDLTMNLLFVDHVAPTERETLDALPEIEEPLVRQALTEYFEQRNRIEVDGVAITPIVERVEVLRPGIELLPLFPISGMRGLLRVHMEMKYPVESPPTRVSFVWGDFPPDLLAYAAAEGEARATGASPPAEPPPLTIEAQLQAEGRVLIIRFSKDEPEHTWHATGQTIEDRFLAVPEITTASPGRRIPALAVGLAAPAALLVLAALIFRPWTRRVALLAAAAVLLALAAVTKDAVMVSVPGLGGGGGGDGLPSRTAAIDIFRPLHANIYRAFDYAEESDVYDALARSVDGTLLDALYNEIYRSLIMHEEGGAVSRVQAVTPIASEVLTIGQLAVDGAGVETRPGFQVRARWQVEGSVYHWGHSHTRVNEYAADYTVVETPQGWRIAGSTIREQFRVDTPSETEPFRLPPGIEL